jgi:hypothetical protein
MVAGQKNLGISFAEFVQVEWTKEFMSDLGARDAGWLAPGGQKNRLDIPRISACWLRLDSYASPTDARRISPLLI